MQKKILKSEKGSITLFVLLAILFFLIVIFSLFMDSSNKNVIQSSEIDKIKEEYQESVDNIDQIYDDTLNEHITDYLKIGDYVNYNYDTVSIPYNLKATESGYTSNQSIIQTQGLKWRIFAIHEDNTIDLISNETTDQSIYLGGSSGYNNGVLLMNSICRKLYSNADLGIEARSININDMESQLNKEGIKIKNEYISHGNVKYGNTKTYIDENNKYPKLYFQENGSGINTTNVKTDGINPSENGYTSSTSETLDIANNGLTVTQTYYYFEETPNKYFDNSYIYSMIFETKNYYWFASRFTSCDSPYANFGLYRMNFEGRDGGNLFGSNGYTHGNSYYLRPIVSIKNSQMQPCTGNSADGIDTTISHMHQIIPTK